jgi:hypothetical protein
MQPDRNALDVIRASVEPLVPAPDRAQVQALIVEELRRLQEGVLARYRLRPSERDRWQAAQNTR